MTRGRRSSTARPDTLIAGGCSPTTSGVWTAPVSGSSRRRRAKPTPRSVCTLTACATSPESRDDSDTSRRTSARLSAARRRGSASSNCQAFHRATSPGAASRPTRSRSCSVGGAPGGEEGGQRPQQSVRRSPAGGRSRRPACSPRLRPGRAGEDRCGGRARREAGVPGPPRAHPGAEGYHRDQALRRRRHSVASGRPIHEADHGQNARPDGGHRYRHLLERLVQLEGGVTPEGFARRLSRRRQGHRGSSRRPRAYSPTRTRCTSLTPSTIWRIFASRRNRPT